MDERIKMVWFDNGRIFIETDKGETLSHRLEVFPALMHASQTQREKFYLWAGNTSIRWEELDEDIHISHFHEEEIVNYDNEVNALFKRFPWIDMQVLAEYLGIHWTKLARFRYGVWTPSVDMLQDIKNAIVRMGKEMTAAAM